MNATTQSMTHKGNTYTRHAYGHWTYETRIVGDPCLIAELDAQQAMHDLSIVEYGSGIAMFDMIREFRGVLSCVGHHKVRLTDNGLECYDTLDYPVAIVMRADSFDLLPLVGAPKTYLIPDEWSVAHFVDMVVRECENM